jgi:hypothetical protein
MERIGGAYSRFQRYTPQIQQLADIRLPIQRRKELETSMLRAQVHSAAVKAKTLLHAIQPVTADYTQGCRDKE